MTTTKDENRKGQRRRENQYVSNDKRQNDRRTKKLEDDKRKAERRNAFVEVPDEKRQGERRKAKEPHILPENVKRDRRIEQRRNSSLHENTTSPVTRFKSGVSSDDDKRVKDRRYEELPFPPALDPLEADALLSLNGTRKQERRNASLRGAPPSSTKDRFKSGVPTDCDHRSTDRRTEIPEPNTPIINRRKRTSDRRTSTGAVILSLIPGGKDRRVNSERRTITRADGNFITIPNTRKGTERRQNSVHVANERRKGDRRDKSELNRRDAAIVSGLDPAVDRRSKEEPSLSSERRDSNFASGFLPEADRRQPEEKEYNDIDGVSTGNHESLAHLKNLAPSDDLFITGQTASSESGELPLHPRPPRPKEEEIPQSIRTGDDDLPLH